MNKTITYQPLSHVVVRFPALNISILERALKDSNFFHEVIQTNDFKEALFFASPDMYSEYTKYILDEMSLKDAERMQNTIVKYLSRITTRATPFASFATCGVATINHQCMLNSNNTKALHFRYDMEFLCFLANNILSRFSEIFTIMTYSANPTLYKIGNKYRYIEMVNGLNAQWCDIKATSILTSIIGFLNKDQSYENICNFVCSKYDISSDKLLRYIRGLHDAQIILSNLTPNVIGHDYLERLCHLATRINDLPIQKYFSKLLTNINILNASNDFQSRKDVYESTFSLNKKFNINVNPKHVFQIDSYILDNALSIPKSIIPQLFDCFNLLNRIAFRFNRPRLANFIAKFSARYEMAYIPLLEAVDPDIGIGYDNHSAAFTQPLLNELKAPKKNNNSQISANLTPFLTELLKNYPSIADINCHIISLSGSDFEKFREQPIHNLPLSLSAMFKIVGYNHDGYILDGLHFSGSSAANLLARFSDGHPEIKDLIVHITENEQKTTNEHLICEISHLPQPHIGNILLRSKIRDAAINYLCPSPAHECQIPLSDIIIGVRNGCIILKSKRLNKIIEPRLTTAHNYDNNTSIIYKFLCDLQHQNVRSGLYFSWGNMESIYKHLPRVIYKNIILAREQWLLKPSDFKDNGKFSIPKFKKVCQDLRICKSIMLMQGDNTLFVDTTNDMSISAFFSAIGSSQLIKIEEFIPTDYATLKKRHIAPINECIIPFIRTQL